MSNYLKKLSSYSLLHLSINNLLILVDARGLTNIYKLSDDARRGIFTTGIIATVDSNEIYLVFTGRNHAGENLERLLKDRQGDLEKLLVMCDALSRNMPKNASLKALLIMCYCLVHARRNFFECRDEYPEFCDKVLESFAGIYKNEAHFITTMNAKVNPVSYLTVLQDNAKAVRKSPHLWLPWNYEQNTQPITLLDTG